MNDHSAWIESRNSGWRNPTGFLAVTGMHWLSEEPQTFDDVSGSWRAEGHNIFATGFEGGEAEQTWTLEPRAELMVPMTGGVLEIASRGGNIILRPRHENSKMFELFDGVITYDYKPEFVVTATLEAEVKEVPVSSVLAGEEVRLTGFTRSDPESLWVIFRDATSGKETYGTGRYVFAKHLEGDKWEIDFNKSANFPCAYTDFATCPVAPRENHLDVAIAAGEKTPKIKSTADGVITL